jgi:hypothetical protein
MFIEDRNRSIEITDPQNRVKQGFMLFHGLWDNDNQSITHVTEYKKERKRIMEQKIPR